MGKSNSYCHIVLVSELLTATGDWPAWKGLTKYRNRPTHVSFIMGQIWESSCCYQFVTGLFNFSFRKWHPILLVDRAYINYGNNLLTRTLNRHILFCMLYVSTVTCFMHQRTTWKVFGYTIKQILHWCSIDCASVTWTAPQGLCFTVTNVEWIPKKGIFPYYQPLSALACNKNILQGHEHRIINDISYITWKDG